MVIFILLAKARMLGYSSRSGASQIICLGIHPVLRKKGVYPVDSEVALLHQENFNEMIMLYKTLSTL
ncbi:hypothetical protein PISMIDRAFT_110627 [Pisolithus microcarpus 441]|uniref:Unplaced genomic scaffold scaffold_134, whole genome shotgun sequence n=1 Tax=Pisolithus microcarpus 441 TaxID=765257 RepID=A0A0C9XZ49_9AGAM|nr:hypothetical protein PISMIDRAFT_110627 [Pisolithus microcarpus 441]